MLREGAANNIVQLIGVRLERNTAQYGGGLYLALYGNTIASSNTFAIDSCDVMGNSYLISGVHSDVEWWWGNICTISTKQINVKHE